jgi:hypothetical protein
LQVGLQSRAFLKLNRSTSAAVRAGPKGGPLITPMLACVEAITRPRTQRAHLQDMSRLFCRLVAISSPTLDHDVIKIPVSVIASLAGQLIRVGG